MKTSISSIGRAIFERMAKKSGSTLYVMEQRTDLKLGFCLETVMKEDEDLYLWDWEFGLIKIENPKNHLGLIIFSAICEDQKPELRNKTPRFSHVVMHDRSDNTMWVSRFYDGVSEIKRWKDSFDFQLHQGPLNN